MVTIHVVNIEGKGTLPIHGDGKTESLAAGYDIVAVDDPTVVGDLGREITLEDGTKVPLYKNISYLEYHTAIKIQPLHTSNGDYHHVDMHPRSSVRKYNLVLANSIGLIDNDYRGEILVSFKYFFQPEDFVIEFTSEEGKVFQPQSLMAGINWSKVYRKGDKIAQLVAEKTNPTNYTFVSELAATARGEGGFGSTGQQAAPTLAEPTSGLAELYNKAGGVPTRKRYIDQVREREGLTATPKPPSGQLPRQTGIQERKP
jgi:dUTPase